MAKMKTGLPSQKVTFATAAAAFASIIAPIIGNNIPGLPVEQFKAEFVTIVTFLAGYMMPPSENDQVNMSGDN